MVQQGKHNEAAAPLRRFTTEQLVTWSVLAVVAMYVLWEVHIFDILGNGTPAATELAVHLHEPAWLRHHLLPHGLLTGWSPDWYGGYPSGTFYFPLGPALTALLDVVLPYNVAFKLTTAAGLVALPFAAYWLGRWFDQDRLHSACLAVATLPVLLQPTTLLGGSIGSTAGSEYSYQLSLAVSLLVIGLAAKGLRTGRYRAATAILLAATMLLHLLPGVMAAVGVLVIVAMHPAVARLRWALVTFAGSAALLGFWLVPWVLRAQYTAGPSYPKVALSPYLFYGPFAPVLVIACLGAFAFLAELGNRRDRLGLFLVAMAGLSALAAAVIPASRVWNGRIVPFWFLWVSLLAGHTVARLAAFIDEERREAMAMLFAPVALIAATVLLWDSPVGSGLAIGPHYDVSDFAGFVYRGYEHSKDRAEYQGFINVMRQVGREHGCGRAQWEWNTDKWDDEHFALLTLLPYWTNGCVSSMHGLFPQSAATSPYESLANGHLAENGGRLDQTQVRNKLDINAGVADLRVLGVRYYIAVSETAQQAADENADLQLVAETKPFADRHFKVYEVRDVAIVEPASHLPVVVHTRSWERSATDWFQSGAKRDVPMAASGPKAWPRGKVGQPSDEAPSTEISDVRLGDNRVSFHVATTGTPVLVKVSYFPNWKAHGAQGPWRVAPNYMVVVPTAHDVTLHYQRTGVDWLGIAVTVAGIVGLVLLARSKPVDMPVPVEEPPAPERGPARRPQKKKGKKRRR